jgi:hypothetical protein
LDHGSGLALEVQAASVPSTVGLRDVSIDSPGAGGILGFGTFDLNGIATTSAAAFGLDLSGVLHSATDIAIRGTASAGRNDAVGIRLESGIAGSAMTRFRVEGTRGAGIEVLGPPHESFDQGVVSNNQVGARIPSSSPAAMIFGPMVSFEENQADLQLQ